MAPGASPLSVIPAPQVLERAAAGARPAPDAGFLAFLAPEADAAPRQPPSTQPEATARSSVEPAATGAEMANPSLLLRPAPIPQVNIAAEDATVAEFVATPDQQTTAAQPAPTNAGFDRVGPAGPLAPSAQTPSQAAPSPVFALADPTPFGVTPRIVDQPVAPAVPEPATAPLLPPGPAASSAAVPPVPVSAAPPSVQSTAPIKATAPSIGADPRAMPAPPNAAPDAVPISQSPAAESAARPGPSQALPPVADTIDMRAGPAPEGPSMPRQPVPTTTPATTTAPTLDPPDIAPSPRIKAAEQSVAAAAAPAPAQAATAAPPPGPRPILSEPPATDGIRSPATLAPDGARPGGVSPAVARVIEAMQASPAIAPTATPQPRPNTSFTVPPAATPAVPSAAPQPRPPSPPPGPTTLSSVLPEASPAPRPTSTRALATEPTAAGGVAKPEAGPPAAASMRPTPPTSSPPPELIAAPQLRDEPGFKPPTTTAAWEPAPRAALPQAPYAYPDRPDIASPPITSLDPLQDAALSPVAANGEGSFQSIDELAAISAAPLREVAAGAPVTGSPAAPALARAQQIAAQITAQTANLTSIADRAAPLEIALDPPELGQLRISVARGEDGIVLNVAVDRPETLELMRRHAGLLSQEFQRHGLENTGFSFSGRDDDQPMPGHASPESASITPPDAAPEARQTTATRQGDGTSLDIRI